MIRKPRKEEVYTEKIGYSIREIDRISEVVNQLLILARFDKATHKTNKHLVNVQTCIDDVLYRYRTTILKKNLSLNVKATDSSTITSDPYYIDLILDNILSNAIKYSNQHSPIDIRIYKKQNRLFCQIQDQGIGIKSADLEHIFNPFYRSDALNHKTIKGNGLGLSIVKKSCDLLDIGITVSSKLNQGTSFLISFAEASQEIEV